MYSYLVLPNEVDQSEIICSLAYRPGSLRHTPTCMHFPHVPRVIEMLIIFLHVPHLLCEHEIMHLYWYCQLLCVGHLHVPQRDWVHVSKSHLSAYPNVNMWGLQEKKEIFSSWAFKWLEFQTFVL